MSKSEYKPLKAMKTRKCFAKIKLYLYRELATIHHFIKLLANFFEEYLIIFESIFIEAFILCVMCIENEKTTSRSLPFYS